MCVIYNTVHVQNKFQDTHYNNNKILLFKLNPQCAYAFLSELFAFLFLEL